MKYIEQHTINAIVGIYVDADYNMHCGVIKVGL